jgi:ATP-dependent Clp protease ATP-binding subunit ClpA
MRRRGTMWEKFRLSQEARKAIVIAPLAASDLGASEIDTEHLLLALSCWGETVAGVIIEEGLAIPKLVIHKELGREIRRGEGSAGQEVRLTARATRAIELADEEAKGFGDQ